RLLLRQEHVIADERGKIPLPPGNQQLADLRPIPGDGIVRRDQQYGAPAHAQPPAQAAGKNGCRQHARSPREPLLPQPVEQLIQAPRGHDLRAVDPATRDRTCSRADRSGVMAATIAKFKSMLALALAGPGGMPGPPAAEIGKAVLVER